MTSPINTNNRTTAGSFNSSADTKQLRENTDSNTSSAVKSTDTVSLSQESQQVVELQLRLKNTPEIDSAKVEAIKQEIAKGNYPLDAEKIASNLIDLERSLIE